MQSVRDVTYQLLREFGLTTFFGNVGSTEEIFLKNLPWDFRYVLALQEASVIGMADGFAQATGQPALVNVHTGAGLGVTTRKCQNCPVRENQIWTNVGVQRELAPIERVEDAAEGIGSSLQGEKRPPNRLISIAIQSFSVDYKSQCAELVLLSLSITLP
jgi:hypothetical protein